jgi:hypothetical protein
MDSGRSWKIRGGWIKGGAGFNMTESDAVYQKEEGGFIEVQ